jgi:hypothetical protein
MSTQRPSSAKNPSGHVQTYEPGLFVHAPGAHGVPVAHSLMSAQAPPVAGAAYPALQEHAYVPGRFEQATRSAPHVVAVAHSSTSVHAPPVAGAAYPDAHAQE